MSTKPVDAGSLKEGSFVVIDGHPCRVLEVERSKTGKHGSAKVRMVAVGIFDGVKRTLVVPADSRIETPMVRKFSGQVLATLGDDTVQLMSMEDYSTFEAPMPEDPDLRARVEPGVEVEVWEIMGRYKIMRTLRR
ncbi:MAG: translation initiation factor IF-5A [Thermofilaceae archaeon]|nr:translation initiation factor IF-5A [Thermofilaceae archaeon]MCX8181136.1 translation initiation factor IF-5A [Thermofilaceae archaeon]MDW8004759.1 translation initiation factor IF-5A [Thermofilaceae archaeon]